MPLCSRCDGLRPETFYQTHTEPDEESSQVAVEPSSYLLWDSGPGLDNARRACEFCALLWAALLAELEKQEPRRTWLRLLPESGIRLEAKADIHKTTFPEPPSKGHHITSLQVIATAAASDGPKLLRGKVRLFAPRHPLSTLVERRDIVGRPRLSGLACQDTMSLLRHWVAACKERHPQCCHTLSGEVINERDPSEILPSRVLCVNKDHVRVVQSNMRPGRYVTLSHCWGPPGKGPLCLLKSNIREFEQEIPWGMLPKTYQDAITIVRALDIPYIWIDSLCIVQDDHDDWLRESALMGAVYERAEFTIAGSHASNSSEGFLHERPEAAPAVELPNFLRSTSHPTTTVFARLRDNNAAEAFPENGALNMRAWATQEWLLSRRVVFFAPANVMWSCKAITQGESGERCFNISRNVRWKTVVEAYSERGLTYATDKLVALDGLRTALQKRYGNTYLHGVWEESLPDQLLWQVAHRLDAGGAAGADGVPGGLANPLGLPSWTWARVPCGVRFLKLDAAKSLCQVISASESKAQLTIRSRVRPLLRVTSHLPPGSLASGDAVADRIWSDIETSHAKETHSLAKFVMDDANSRPIGWVVYDVQDATAAGVGVQDSMLALMSSLGRKEDESERARGSAVSNKNQRQHWCLVLRTDADGTARRVGVGKTYSREWWLDARLQDITMN